MVKVGGMASFLRLTEEGRDELERLGVDRVRELYEANHWNPVASLDVQEWLMRMDADALQTQVMADEAEREALEHARWTAEHELTTRAVEAAEASAEATKLQAVYAKRAYERSNVALWLSGIAVIVTVFFSLLAFLKP